MIITTVTQPGNQLISSLDGGVVLNTGLSDIKTYKGENVRTTFDNNGTHVFRANGEEAHRFGYAVETDDDDVVVTSRSDTTVQDVLGA